MSHGQKPLLAARGIHRDSLTLLGRLRKRVMDLAGRFFFGFTRRVWGFVGLDTIFPS